MIWKLIFFVMTKIQKILKNVLEEMSTRNVYILFVFSLISYNMFTLKTI